MKQIFIFGASTVYGVGGEEGGWADMLKRELHKRMYYKGGPGEIFEVYIFAKPGATVEFIFENFENQIKKYSRGDEKIAIVSVGMNNTKAVGNPNDFVSDIEIYKKSMNDLLVKMKLKVDEVICVGYRPVDESKTLPKLNPVGGSPSYFWNERINKFNKVYKQVCQELGVKFIDLNIDKGEWITKYLNEDGLHPNTKGHELIFQKLLPEVENLLK